ncbi:unknown [Sutterella sp. CAG:521]|nr:unknown [Sutterella sp. CAG:521]
MQQSHTGNKIIAGFIHIAVSTACEHRNSRGDSRP